MSYENGLSLTPANAGGPVFYQYLLTGGTGQTSGGNTSSTLVPDARVLYDSQDASNLPHGPFQLTQNVHLPHFPYDSYAASPVHRYFQMYQELDCSVATETTNNPSGCLSDLWPWVETTVSSGSNGKAPPAGKAS